jgi:hypothetical protein
MVSTSENRRASRFFLDYCVSAMAANIVKCAKLSIFSKDNDETKTCKLESTIVARFLESRGMGDIYPGLPKLLVRLTFA